MNRTHGFFATITMAVLLVSCSNNNAETTTSSTLKETSSSNVDKHDTAENKITESSVQDGPAIATLETNDFVLKIHRAIPFELKPKSYQPFKVDPSTKLVALDISVRNKLSTPLDFARILGMTVIKGKEEGGKNLVAPWVVAAHEVDYPEPNHQKEYDALWNEHFEANGFHRATLFGMNPKKEEKTFTLIVPAKADFDHPMNKSIDFSIE